MIVKFPSLILSNHKIRHESVSVFRDIAFVKYILFYERTENETPSIVTIMLSKETKTWCVNFYIHGTVQSSPISFFFLHIRLKYLQWACSSDMANFYISGITIDIEFFLHLWLYIIYMTLALIMNYYLQNGDNVWFHSVHIFQMSMSFVPSFRDQCCHWSCYEDFVQRCLTIIVVKQISLLLWKKLSTSWEFLF